MTEQPIQLTPGSDLSILDIFLSAGGSPLNADTVVFYLLDANNVVAASGTPTNPATGEYNGAGTVPAGFTFGTWRINWNIYPVGGSFTEVAEEFCVQPIDVAFTNRPSTDILGSMYDAVRHDIGDPDAKVFSDEFLRHVLIKAVRRLNHRLGLAPTMRGPIGIPGNFGGRRIRVIPLTLDVSAGTINPPGDEYEDLLILQMEYVIVTSELTALKRLQTAGSSGPYAITNAGAENEGIKVVNADGVEVSISGGRLRERSALARFDVQTRKEELETAIREYRNRLSGNFGKLIW